MLLSWGREAWREGGGNKVNVNKLPLVALLYMIITLWMMEKGRNWLMSVYEISLYGTAAVFCPSSSLFAHLSFIVFLVLVLRPLTFAVDGPEVEIESGKRGCMGEDMINCTLVCPIQIRGDNFWGLNTCSVYESLKLATTTSTPKLLCLSSSSSSPWGRHLRTLPHYSFWARNSLK